MHEPETTHAASSRRGNVAARTVSQSTYFRGHSAMSQCSTSAIHVHGWAILSHLLPSTQHSKCLGSSKVLLLSTVTSYLTTATYLSPRGALDLFNHGEGKIYLRKQLCSDAAPNAGVPIRPRIDRWPRMSNCCPNRLCFLHRGAPVRSWRSFR